MGRLGSGVRASFQKNPAGSVLRQQKKRELRPRRFCPEVELLPGLSGLATNSSLSSFLASEPVSQRSGSDATACIAARRLHYQQPSIDSQHQHQQNARTDSTERYWAEWSVSIADALLERTQVERPLAVWRRRQSTLQPAAINEHTAQRRTDDRPPDQPLSPTRHGCN